MYRMSQNPKAGTSASTPKRVSSACGDSSSLSEFRSITDRCDLSSDFLEGCMALYNDANDQSEEGRTFEKGRDDDHTGLDTPRHFRLPGHALQRGATNAA